MNFNSVLKYKQIYTKNYLFPDGYILLVNNFSDKTTMFYENNTDVAFFPQNVTFNNS